MNKSEMKKFCEWAIQDPYLSKFICRNDKYFVHFRSPIDIFLEIYKYNYTCETYPLARKDEWPNYYSNDPDNMMEKLSLEDAKKYVVELSKYGIIRENEEKKAKILKNLNDL